MATPAPPYGAAQPIADFPSQLKQMIMHMLHMDHPAPVQQAPAPVAPLPSAWEQANKQAQEQQMQGARQKAAQSLGRATPKGK